MSIDMPSVTQVKTLFELMMTEWVKYEKLDPLVEQINSIRAVDGTFWLVELLLAGSPSTLSRDILSPLPGGLVVYKEDGTPNGMLTIWHERGVLTQIEYGAFDYQEVHHYPYVDECRVIELTPEWGGMGGVE